jgi:formylglycine-generating enzyme required for sulfatase activity
MGDNNMAIASKPNELTLHRYRRTNKSYTEDLGDGVKLTLMLIPAGEFLMGAPEDELESTKGERPQHQVQVSQFLMGRYPVTQAQWRVVAGYPQESQELNPDPSDFKGPNCPVENVSWEDAQEFCQRLSTKSGKTYCLPSEAQWEYACRAGTTTPFHYGETLSDELANYSAQDEKIGDTLYNGVYGRGVLGQYRKETTDVGQFPANLFGLHDMHGNVLEWCEDDYHSNYEGAPKDGSAWVETDRKELERLLRGGSWFGLPEYCRSACRYNITRDNRNHYIGFRVSCVSPSSLLSA